MSTYASSCRTNRKPEAPGFKSTADRRVISAQTLSCDPVQWLLWMAKVMTSVFNHLESLYLISLIRVEVYICWMWLMWKNTKWTNVFLLKQQNYKKIHLVFSLWCTRPKTDGLLMNYLFTLTSTRNAYRTVYCTILMNGTHGMIPIVSYGYTLRIKNLPQKKELKDVTEKLWIIY